MRRFLVTRLPGPRWQAGAALQNQNSWSEHAAFMKDLSDRGLVVMGGPMEEGDEIILIANADNEAEVRNAFASDPWEKAGILTTSEARPWTVVLEFKG